jgi:hypothetical protein
VRERLGNFGNFSRILAVMAGCHEGPPVAEGKVFKTDF